MRTGIDDMRLTSAGLLMLLAAAAMTLLSGSGSTPLTAVWATSAYTGTDLQITPDQGLFQGR